MFLIIKGIRPHFPLSLCIYLGRVVSGIWVSIPAFCPSYCHNTIKTALVPNTSHYRKYHVMVDLLTPSCKFSYSHHMDTTVTIIICFCIKFPPPCHILDYFLCYIIDNGIHSWGGTISWLLIHGNKSLYKMSELMYPSIYKHANFTDSIPSLCCNIWEKWYSKLFISHI